MKRILNLYIIREISSLFLLSITIFTLILLMGRMLKLIELIVSRGVPLTDVCRMIIYLMPSFLVFTIPMAFLLAVLLAFGRLSADNEIIVLKASGISLIQIVPPVAACGMFAAGLSLAASLFGVPWGNSAFKDLSFKVMKQYAGATIREKVFWDDIPGIVMYTEQYDERKQALQGVIIHDGRNKERLLTIFARRGAVSSGADREGLRLTLNNGIIHSPGKKDEYRLVHFEEYVMSVTPDSPSTGSGRNEQDMGITELLTQSRITANDLSQQLKIRTELHSRFSFPFASVVFAFVAVPLGIQNRRSGKSSGFTLSLGIIFSYYLLLSFVRTLAERGSLSPLIALWLPNVLFLVLGIILLKMASQERNLTLPGLNSIVDRFRKSR
ncbi:MAG: LPS export ABC transporter permease LptF [Desulfuromonadales bacterium]